MKVWIICQHAGSPRHGMNFRPYHIGRELLARGMEVTVFSGSTSHEYYAPPAMTGRYTFEDVDGLRYCWIRTKAYGESRSPGRMMAWLSYLAGLFGIGRLRLAGPDAIIVSSPPPYPVIAGAWLARKHGARLVFEVRDLWPLSLVELGEVTPRHPFIRLTQWVEDFAYRRADTVVSALPAALPYMRGRGLAEGKFIHVPNGLSQSGTALPAPDPSIRAALPGRSFIVGYAGKIGIAYGLDTLVDAAAILRDRRDIGIIVVGTGSDRAALAARAAREGLDNILFLRPVPRERIPAVLAAFDVCYLGLKRRELFRHGVSPTKLFDYMGAGKPIIMGIHAGNDPVTEAGCGITVPPEDPPALAEAIRAMASLEPAARDALGVAARGHALRNHDWSVLGERYLDALGLPRGGGT